MGRAVEKRKQEEEKKSMLIILLGVSCAALWVDLRIEILTSCFLSFAAVQNAVSPRILHISDRDELLEVCRTNQSLQSAGHVLRIY